MRPQTQPSLWACLATSFAIAIDVDVQVLFDEMGHDGGEVVHPALGEPERRRGHHVQELIDCCDRRGIWVTSYDVMPVAAVEPSGHSYVVWDEAYCMDRLWKIIKGNVGVFMGLSPAGRPHAWAWSGEYVVDPAHGRADGLFRYSPQNFLRLRAEQSEGKSEI